MSPVAPSKVAHKRSPSKLRRKRMDPFARKSQLLDGALEAFASRGVARAGHADVALVAHISVPTVFAYFPTKRELVEAVLNETERFLFSVIEEGRNSGGSAREMLLKIFEVFISNVDSRPAVMRVWLDWSTSIREEVWHRYVEVQERIIDSFRQLVLLGQSAGEIAGSVDPGDAAHLLVGQAHMLVLMRFANVDRRRVAHFIGHLVDSAVPLAVEGAAARRRSPKSASNR